MEKKKKNDAEQNIFEKAMPKEEENHDRCKSENAEINQNGRGWRRTVGTTGTGQRVAQPCSVRSQVGTVQESGQELVMKSHSGTCWENVAGESKQGTHFTLTHPTAGRCSETTGPRMTSQQNV